MSNSLHFKHKPVSAANLRRKKLLSDKARSHFTPPVKAYPKIVLFDANKDGRFNKDERLALGQAMRDGTGGGPANRNPEGEQPAHPGIIIQRIANLYGVAFSFDADEDDRLNKVIQAALKREIEKAEVKRPGLGGGPASGVGGRPF